MVLLSPVPALEPAPEGPSSIEDCDDSPDLAVSVLDTLTVVSLVAPEALLSSA